MKLSIIVEDKSIVKNNNDHFSVEDNSWWNQFDGIHAIQLDEDNNINEVQLKNNEFRQASNSEITTIKNKITELETTYQQELDNWNNSWDRVKMQRNKWLHKTDKYMIEDFAISAEQRNSIKAYRQSLRDLTDTYNGHQPVSITFNNDGHVFLDNNKIITNPV